jgi:hypothetical protein
VAKASPDRFVVTFVIASVDEAAVREWAAVQEESLRHTHGSATAHIEHRPAPLSEAEQEEVDRAEFHLRKPNEPQTEEI